MVVEEDFKALFVDRVDEGGPVLVVEVGVDDHFCYYIMIRLGVDCDLLILIGGD